MIAKNILCHQNHTILTYAKQIVSLGHFCVTPYKLTIERRIASYALVAKICIRYKSRHVDFILSCAIYRNNPSSFLPSASYTYDKKTTFSFNKVT